MNKEEIEELAAANYSTILQWVKNGKIDYDGALSKCQELAQIVVKQANTMKGHAEIIQEQRKRIMKLENKLNQWIQPCFCVVPERKCLMCETKELLNDNL